MPPSERPRSVRDAVRSYQSWAETLTVCGVVSVAMSFFWLPKDLKSLGVQASLGLTLMISAYVASNNLRSTRRHHVAVQLSNAAMHVGSHDPTIQMAGIYLLSSLRTDRNADPEMQRGAERLLMTLREQAPHLAATIDRELIRPGSATSERPDRMRRSWESPALRRSTTRGPV